MRTILIAFGLILFLVAVFWVGMMANFPGAAGSRYIESLVNRDGRVVLRMSPLELRWNRIVAERVTLDAKVGDTIRPVIAFHNTEIPLSFGLFSGLHFRASTAGRGRLEGFWPWDESEARIDVTALRLAEIPVAQWLHPARIDGELNIRSTFAKSAGAHNALPSGQITVQGKNILLEGIEIMGVILPPTRLETLGVQLRLGRTIDVRQISMTGDIQGSIRGTVTPVVERLDRSSLKLEVELDFHPEWIDEWGDLALILEAYLNQGRLAGTLTGTPARPVFRNSRRR